MEETKLKQFRRHDFVIISKEGRERICAELITNYNCAKRNLVQDVFSDKYGENGIPGIVRRATRTERVLVPIGFVPLERFDGNRLRIGAFAHLDEVMKVITPYELLQMPFKCRNRCMQAASKIAMLSRTKKSKVVGILGSAGLEIFTGCDYTNEDSDLDLVIRDCEYGEIVEIYNQIKDIGAEYKVQIDLEIALNNGYGVKAVELFMDSRTLLGKSLDDVILLERKAVLEVLTKKERYYNGN